MNEEEYLRDQLAILHRAYRLQAEPYIRKLAAIEACKSPPPITLEFADLDADTRRRLIESFRN